MLTGLEIAQVCADTYDSNAKWDGSWSTNDIQVRARTVGDFEVIAFRGSIDAIDWVRDFQVIPIFHPRLGMVHDGFLHGMEVIVIPKLMHYISQSNRPYIITGHSLGAARACIAAGLLAITPFPSGSTIPPAALVTFGCPRPGFRTLSDVIKSSGAQVRIYKNRRDHVAEVPTLLPFWEKPVHDTPIDGGETHERSLFADHHMSLYIEGMKKYLLAQVKVNVAGPSGNQDQGQD